MAIFKSKVANVTDIISQNIHKNIKNELRNRLATLAYEQIDSIVEEVAKDLVNKIESLNDMNGEINLYIYTNKIERKEYDND